MTKIEAVIAYAVETFVRLDSSNPKFTEAVKELSDFVIIYQDENGKDTRLKFPEVKEELINLLNERDMHIGIDLSPVY